jgi:hydroxycarboxylate dehydrogenase B
VIGERYVDHARLQQMVSEVFRRGGSAVEEAALVASHLVRANLAGHDSHGVGMVPTYVRHLGTGHVVPNTPAKVTRDDGSLLMFDGQRGYGRRVAGEAMATAIARCHQTGVVVVTLANAHHIGRVGAYGELTTEAGLVSLHFVNVTDHRGLVAPFRGSDARFSTNPICIALPGTAARPPVLLDMATSEIAMGKVRVARNAQHPAPAGSLIDSEGRPTTDPDVMYQEPFGALLPFGRHKGYGLAVLAELLAGGMSGGGTIQPDNPRLGGIVNNMFSILVDPMRLAGTDWLAREIDGFVAYVKDSPPVDPGAPVLVPGDPERMTREERLRTGIPIDATTWDEILEAVEQVGLARTEAESLVSGRQGGLR